MSDSSEKPSPQHKPTAAQLARYAEHFNQSATLRHFGVQISFPSPERIRATIAKVAPEQRGGLGTQAVNGGVLAGLFDLVIGSVPALISPSRRSATVQLSMSFERPVHGDSIHAEAWVDNAGKSIVFASAEIYDAQGQACARCQGLIRISQKEWDSGESPAIN